MISRPIEERLVFGLFDIVSNKELEDVYRIQAMESLIDIVNITFFEVDKKVKVSAPPPVPDFLL